MRQKRLQIDFEYKFSLLGIISSIRSYKLAWSVNQALNIDLQSEPDLVIEFSKNQSISIENYLFETEHCLYRLLKNKPVDSFGKNQLPLLPEMGHLDYLIMIEGETYPVTINDVREKLKTLNTVEMVVPINVENLKSKENLLF